MRYVYSFLIVFLLWSCQDISDAEFSDRETFIHLYEGVTPYSATAAEETGDGFILVGNTTITDDSVVTVVISTDRLGNERTRKYYPNVTSKAIGVIRSGANDVSGYIIVGDSIKITPGADPAANTEIYSVKVLKLDANTNLVKEQTITDTNPNPGAVKVDFKASAVTPANNNQVLMLGTYKTLVNAPEKPFLISFSDDLNTVNWTENYDVIERNYINARSLHERNGQIIWASAILKPQGSFNDSYVSIPLVEEGSVFVNNDLYKENQSQLLLAGDLQPASLPEFGYGFIGTYGTTAGDRTNILFMRVDVQGKIIAGSQRYFDGGKLLVENALPSSETESVTEDSGLSLTSTSDGGFVLGCSMTSTPSLGNGLRDILLIKVDALGNHMWSKLIGGSGDEVVSTIRETADKGLLIMGTSTISGFSNMFIVKTDARGELKN